MVTPAMFLTLPVQLEYHEIVVKSLTVIVACDLCPLKICHAMTMCPVNMLMMVLGPATVCPA